MEKFTLYNFNWQEKDKPFLLKIIELNLRNPDFNTVTNEFFDLPHDFPWNKIIKYEFEGDNLLFYFKS